MGQFLLELDKENDAIIDLEEPGMLEMLSLQLKAHRMPPDQIPGVAAAPVPALSRLLSHTTLTTTFPSLRSIWLPSAKARASKKLKRVLRAGYPFASVASRDVFRETKAWFTTCSDQN